MTILKHLLADASLATSACVIRTGLDGSRSFVVLDQTVAHVRGGGQLGDRGSICGLPLFDVQRVDGEVRHYIEGLPPAVGAIISLEIDPVFRHVCSRWHTAGHLLAAAMEQEIPGFSANASQHWPTDAWVAGAWSGPLADEIVLRLQRFVDVAIQADLRVTVVANKVRTVAIDRHREVACGGTHVSSLAAIGLLRIENVRIKKGVLKTRYMCSDDEGI